MSRKRVIGIALMGFGLVLLVLSLNVYLVICSIFRSYYFQYDHMTFPYPYFRLRDAQDVLATYLCVGFFFLLGCVLTTLGGLSLSKIKASFGKIASVLLLVSLFLPWWQLGRESHNFSNNFSMLLQERQTIVETRNFLFGTLKKSSSVGIRFIPYLTLKSSYGLYPDEGFIVGSWLDTLLVRVLCCVVFGLLLFASVLGWSDKKKRRFVGLLAGCISLILFVVWLSIAWSAFGLDRELYGLKVNPYFVFYLGLLSNFSYYSFISVGFFVAVIGEIILALSLLVKGRQKILPPTTTSV